ncbi:FHA domain-containing protein [Psychrobacter sp. S1-30-MNA-CIBAN-0213]|uniref:FHA domain-containing protein n=1 Tax=unclassified Psychrobacter TaxID=196806 RepID=UPI00333059C0
MTSNLDENNVSKTEAETVTWQLNALTEALGDLTLTVNDSLSIGRGNDNDVVLGSKSVSRNHALLSVLNGDLYIKDLDSSNGTFINDKRIEGNKSTHLNSNDTVGFASFVFKVAAPMEAETDSAPVAKPVIGTQADVTSSDAEVANTDEQEKEAPSVVVTPTEQPAVLESSQVDAQDTTKTLDESVIDADSVVSSPVVSPVAPATEENTVVDSVDSTKMDSVKTERVLNEKVDEPVVKETIVTEVLSSADSETAETPAAPIAEPASQPTSAPSTAAEKETVMSNDKSQETLNNEPLNNELTANESVATKQPVAHQEPEVAPEHDKTTKTTLQEEADPDVLRAKQAATAQFSGTANLGQARDLGTEGNNAMDQAIDNPANAGYVEKKPSGSWFIWVFIVILIIGIALWLFNMGGV